MSIKGLLFSGIFFLCVAGALFFPPLGIYGYILDYTINPAAQWWGRPLAIMGIRFALTIAVATAIGILLQRKSLNFGEKIFCKQEYVFIIFLLVLWGVYFLTPETVGRYTIMDHPSVKLTKIFIFVMMMTHVITDLKTMRGLFFVFATVSMILGIKAWSIPYSSFSSGRLEGIGGADFSEANFFAAFMAAMLPLIAIMFLRSGWLGKLYYLVAGAFTANAVVLCRSRGAFLGLAMGALAACWYAPKRYRKQIFIIIFIGIVGVVYLSDEFFIERIMTITTDQSEMDTSSSSRLRLWGAGLKMLASRPLGIGPGNWYQTIGNYIPEYEGKDAHSTYIKCLAELGVIGFSVFFLIILQSYQNLRKIYKSSFICNREGSEEFLFFYFSILVSVVILLTCALTISMIYTEILWILLMLPLCLKRAFDNFNKNEVFNEDA